MSRLFKLYLFEYLTSKQYWWAEGKVIIQEGLDDQFLLKLRTNRFERRDLAENGVKPWLKSPISPKKLDAQYP